ncbi:hypothetical protein JOC54_002334 [Alkalihalobacillus xiaoxiensis]|uniref:Sporulation histidine kinase inhibitor Sda n=2 Tax=Shouchella xiaoxiensis TaxID=766895 RepID=A0ABS2SX88_9BACI|nr:hypothetical protein [Shouchella xiaoxiensis]
MAIHELSDSTLLNAYIRAMEHNLKDDFILILRTELLRRGFDLSDDGR